MVSDGAVFDVPKTNEEIKTHLGSCGNYSNVTVSMIRYGTGGDTFALSQFGAISPHMSEVQTITYREIQTCFDGNLTNNKVRIRGTAVSLDGVTFSDSLSASEGTYFISEGDVFIDEYAIELRVFPRSPFWHQI